MTATDFLGVAQIRRTVHRFSFGHWFAVPSGDAVKPHAHEDAHFMFIVAGRYVTRVSGSSGVRLIYNPPDTFHRDRFDSPGSFFAVSIKRRDDLPAVRRSINVIDAASHALVRRLMNECVAWDRDSPLVAESLCSELLGFTSVEERQAPRWLERARAMLHASDANNLTLEAVARAAGVHSVHLTRTFRRFYRCTPGEYVRARRAEAAAALLVSTGRPLSEIALDTGFADQSHFTRAFRRAYGVAPGEYRIRAR